ncbi:hypothetical protein [Streptomyces sp. NPDC052114]|uniref:hypothetical protein n=1 Tax=unclassified Streptomyces TaxID=2593676 RepID=UPI00344A1593
MSRRLQPRHIVLGGRDAVALTPEEYDQLVASRRQIGGQSAKVRVLAQQAKRIEGLLRDLEELTGECTEAACAAVTEADCPRCALAALLRRFREGRY